MTNPPEKNYPLTAKDYEVYEEIGDDVYRAHCIELDEIVAVKIMGLEKCNNDVEAIRKQAHPNPLCSFIDGGSLWVVMPFLFEEDEEEDIPLSDIFPGKLSPIREEEEELHSSSDNSDELKDDEVVNSGIPATVNPLPSNTAQILPMLHRLLISNGIQRERLMGLIQIYDQTSVTIPMVNAEGGEQILTKEEELAAEVQYLDQCVNGLREEIEDLKKVNAELEDEINRLKNNTDQ